MSSPHAELHQRILAGDATGLQQLTTVIFHRICSRLAKAFRRTPVHQLRDCGWDALTDYVTRPSIYDPHRGLTLESFLYIASWRNAANAIRSSRSRRTREQEYARAVLTLSAGIALDSDTPAAAAHDVLCITRKLGADQRERRALLLLLSGERNSALLAGALGIGDLSRDEQRREVKRFKDRVLKRVLRARVLQKNSSVAQVEHEVAAGKSGVYEVEIDNL